MNEEDDVQFLAAATSRKRHHSEMARTHHPNRPSRETRGEGSSSRAPPSRAFSSSRPTLPPLPHMRYPGDGFDFRRPIMSTPPQPENVIDLTNESSPPTAEQTQLEAAHSPDSHHSRGHRAPRFGRNIMADVVDLREEPDTDDRQLSSPEVQVLRPGREARNPNQGLASQTAETLVRGTGALADLIMRLRDGGIPPSNVVGEDTLRREVSRRTRNIFAPIRGHDEETHWIGARPNEEVDLTLDLDNTDVLDMPFDLDYRTAGFAVVGPPGTQAQPSYKPPSPAPEGFTRTTTDEDTLVCPSCQDELGAGENPIKQQIWVAKPCGHVYCGKCCKNRSASRVKRTGQPSASGVKHFSRCVVPDCGKSVSAPKSMFQIYL